MLGLWRDYMTPLRILVVSSDRLSRAGLAAVLELQPCLTVAGQVSWDDDTLLPLDVDGNVKPTWDLPISDAHGITIVEEEGVELLWVADNGRKRQHGLGYQYTPSEWKAGSSGHSVATFCPVPAAS
jgi:hypothetical protein